MLGAQSRRCTATIGSVSEDDIYPQKAIRSIDNQCRNNTEANLKRGLKSLMNFDGEINQLNRTRIGSVSYNAAFSAIVQTHLWLVCLFVLGASYSR